MENSITLYDLNKQVYSQLPSIDPVTKKDILTEYIAQTNGKYYLLLNNDLHYYTFFTAGNSLPEELIKLLKEVMGEVKAIVPQDEMIEIWATFQGEFHMFAFFDYTGGVIECQ